MNPQIEIKHNIGNTISIPNQIDVRATTFTSDVVPAGSTSVPSDNAADFDSGASIFLLLSSLGLGNSEIVRSASHTNTTFTTLATLQNHNRGEIIQQIKYDQVEVYKSATLNGTYAQLAAPSVMQVTQMNSVIWDPAGLSTDYYKVRWVNSITAATSDFSSPISVLAYPWNSAGKLFKSVRTLMGIQENDKIITTDFMIEALDDARKMAEGSMEGIRHPWQQVFEFPIKMFAGRNYVDLPDDLDFKETDQSVLAARFLTNNIIIPFNMGYIDKRTWNQQSYYATGGTLTAGVGIGATSITLNSVGDFAPNGGAAQVATSDYTQTILQIQYTSIDYNTNQLLGVTGVTRALPEGTQVWSRLSATQPVAYTVFDQKLWFTSVIPDVMQGNNVYIDYYKMMVRIENLYDVIPEHYREMYKPYLRWAIKYRKDITLPTSDPDLVKFTGLVTALVANLYTGQGTVVITN